MPLPLPGPALSRHSPTGDGGSSISFPRRGGDDVPTLLAYSTERKRGTVHALLQTDHGSLRLRLTPADAQALGSELRIKAIAPAGERAADPSAPVEKPGGGIL